jgi:hypothetical protein
VGVAVAVGVGVPVLVAVAVAVGVAVAVFVGVLVAVLVGVLVAVLVAVAVAVTVGVLVGVFVGVLVAVLVAVAVAVLVAVTVAVGVSVATAANQFTVLPSFTEFAGFIGAPVVLLLSCTRTYETFRLPVDAKFHCVPGVLETSERVAPLVPLRFKAPVTRCVSPALKVKLAALETFFVKLYRLSEPVMLWSPPVSATVPRDGSKSPRVRKIFPARFNELGAPNSPPVRLTCPVTLAVPAAFVVYTLLPLARAEISAALRARL